MTPKENLIFAICKLVIDYYRGGFSDLHALRVLTEQYISQVEQLRKKPEIKKVDEWLP